MSKKKETGKKKRDLDKYPALNPRLNARTRFEVLDMDYLKKLSDSDLKYLNQFMSEYVSGGFKRDELGNYTEDNLHKTPEERRECYTRNNTRNRCGLTISNATGQTYRCEDINDFMDLLTDTDAMVNSTNVFSDYIQDYYDGNYSNLENEIRQEMLNDLERCLHPKNTSDKKLADSNYGKFLLSKFKNI